MSTLKKPDCDCFGSDTCEVCEDFMEEYNYSWCEWCDKVFCDDDGGRFCSEDCEEQEYEQNAPACEERWEKVVEEWDHNTNSWFYDKEVTIPEDAILVASWNNFGPFCLGPSDVNYIERSIYYDPILEECKAVEDSYGCNPCFNCLSRYDSLIDFSEVDLEDERWEVEDKDLWEEME